MHNKISEIMVKEYNTPIFTQETEYLYNLIPTIGKIVATDDIK